MSTDARQYCELATQLIQESKRSTQTDVLFKYNDALIRSIVREQRDLEKAALALVQQPGPPQRDARLNFSVRLMRTAGSQRGSNFQRTELSSLKPL